MPKGYLIANIEIHDSEAYERYRSRTGEIVEAHSGRFLVRGGKLESLEGSSPKARLVVIEFPSPLDARAFYEDPRYIEIIRHRQDNAATDMLIAEGIT